MDEEAVQKGDHYAGIAGMPMEGDVFDLGGGVVLRKIYAHMFAYFMVAFAEAPPGQPHPGPWKAARPGTKIDITAQLDISAAAAATDEAADAVAQAVLFTIRLGGLPSATLAAVGNAPFTAEAQAHNDAAWIVPAETEHKTFRLFTDDVFGESHADWTAARWPTAQRLTKECAEFALAVDALTVGQIVPRTALTLVGLWAALEALFSPSTSELRFRVSALIAAYLEPPGAARSKRHADVFKLYDKRSAAAHGKPKHESADVLASFNLLREVVTKMLDEGRVPTKNELEKLLFGDAPATPDGT